MLIVANFSMKNFHIMKKQEVVLHCLQALIDLLYTQTFV